MSFTVLAALLLVADTPAPPPLPALTEAPALPAPVQLAEADEGSPGRSATEELEEGEAGESVVITAPRKVATPDPLIGVNAVSFEVTQAVDKAVVGPVAMTFERVVPVPIRSGLRNALINLYEPVVFVNFLLQIKPGKAIETFARFALNSTIGLFGLIDIAKKKPINLPHRPNGFSDTLGFYCVPTGPYFFLPIIGPTTLRDFLGDGIDYATMPTVVGKPFNRPAFALSATALRRIDKRGLFDEKLRELNSAEDPYAARKAFYLNGRQAEIDELRGGKRCGTKKARDPGLDQLHNEAPAQTAPVQSAPATPIEPAPAPSEAPKGETATAN